MNSELWCYKGQERQTLINWLTKNKVKFEDSMTTEELRQLYIKKECGEI